MVILGRMLRALPLLLLSPLLWVLPPAAIGLADLLWFLAGKRKLAPDRMPSTRAASIVIPNWNGRDLLEKYIPSVIAATGHNPANEIIVVDNGSTDGSVEFLRRNHPTVRVHALPENLGFGGGSNEGFREASNDIVILLNSDMRVEQDFVQPLLDAFNDEQVFAVSCQIFFTDPNKVREETGLTQGWWENGGLRVRHRIDDKVNEPFPCFYGGGGSCAFDRNKFLLLGGFDPLLRPFYLEDTDLGYQAWKRGWKVLYQPASVVYHEHRGTIGRKFPPDYIQAVIQKNFLLFTWKNIHSWQMLAAHFFFSGAGSLLSLLFGDSLERPNLLAIGKACLQLPLACASRWRSRSLAGIEDREAFRRSMPGHYRDRFHPMAQNLARPSVLFVSPYPICPPVHGGGVFMFQTARELTRHCDLHLIVLLDSPYEAESHAELEAQCASAEYLVRLEGQPRQFGSIIPHAIHEFANPELEWLIHRQIFSKRVDVVQFEYLPMGQYVSRFQRISEVLFEHDLYFQSIGRQLPYMRGMLQKASATFEYLRALRYELRILPRFDRIQVCSPENKRYLLEFRPELASSVDDNHRAGIAVANYRFTAGNRHRETMLFLGSFRHLPNAEALNWFVQRAMPIILNERPGARLTVIGSDPPPKHSLPDWGDSINLIGFADDIHEPLATHAVFLCPILSGSGVRVKLLEAFASGIPVVSTPLGAEGLATRDGGICMLAATPEQFAQKVIELFDHPDQAAQMATRARAEVERRWDMPAITRELAASYTALVASKRRA
jgi:GT2 family glycosyltransferase/glycosyltransferase involved in cell wall biosynthesis